MLRPELPGLADEIVTELSHGVPDYARPLEGPFGKALRSGVEEALGGFTSMLANPRADRDEGREVYLNLGRGEMRAGRSLDALLAAYRLGARVAWRRLAAAGERAGLPPHTLYALAEAIFAYIDELSADSIEGYAREQAAAAGTLQRRRQRLAALLVQEPPARSRHGGGGGRERRLAAATQPGRVRGGRRRGERRAGRPPGAPARPRVACGSRGAVHRGPGAARRAPRRAGGGRARAQGRAGASGHLAGGGRELRRASELLRLAQDGGIEDTDGLLLADTHKLALLLGVDRRLARDVADAALAPLEAETELSRERLGSTLDAWLRHRGRTEAVARALHVHPQTVRYRLARLRELFGERLEDPDARFELELALRARRVAG